MSSLTSSSIDQLMAFKVKPIREKDDRKMGLAEVKPIREKDDRKMGIAKQNPMNGKNNHLSLDEASVSPASVGSEFYSDSIHSPSADFPYVSQ
jgi:hypothetical protein